MAGLPDDLAARIAANKRRATALLTGAATAVLVIVWALASAAGAGLVGVVLGVLLAAAVTVAAWTQSAAVALSLARAQPADEASHARLHNLVEGLCVAAGVPKPALYIVESERPDAFTVGRGPRQAAVVCTAGLTDKLNRMELEGVIAHELSHVKNYDILPATLAVTLVGVPGALVPPLRAALLRWAVGTNREAVGDVSGVALTRYPPGLIAALEKVRHEGAGAPIHGPKTIDHLWLDSSTEDVDERIAALREL
jgi:heat shock protein HtpX